MLRRGIWRTLARWFARAEALERGASELARQVELDAGRRRFLQATSAGTLAVGLGGLGALSACRTSPDRARASGPVDDRRPEVAILGAGLAGMTCLHRLTQRGMRAVVYEQSERLGGRTWTGRGLFAGGPGGDDPGHMLELGGEFIDTAHVEMLKLAKELGLAVRDTLAASAAPADLERIYFVGGERVSEIDVLTGFVPVAQAISAARQAFAGEDIGYESPSEAAKRYDRMTLAAFLDAAQPGATARAVLEAAYVTEYGIPLEAQSALNLIMMMSDENLARSAGGDAWALFGDSDERWKIQGGNQAISETLAARHRERVRLGWALEAIAERPGGGWRLAFSDGREVLADVVVCTIPFSVLRRLDLAGVDLPATKKKAIAELGYGNNAKLLMPFSARVWEAQGDDGSVYTDLELQDLWAPEPWVRTGRGVLTNFVGGARGRTLGEGTPADQARRLAADLERIWPGAAAAAAVDEARRVYWPTDPGVMGSYAGYLVGQWTSIAGSEAEAVGTLIFAGEHTATDFQGFMGGAVESGERAAAEVFGLAEGIRPTARRVAARRGGRVGMG